MRTNPIKTQVLIINRELVLGKRGAMEVLRQNHRIL